MFFFLSHWNTLVIMGIFLASNIDRKPMLSRIEQGVKNIFHNPTDPFYTGRVMDVLFSGVEFDCSATDPFTTAICGILEDEKAIKKIDDDHFAFTLLGGVSATFFIIFFLQYTHAIYFLSLMVPIWVR